MNHCTGELVALQESAGLLPQVTPAQADSCGISINAVGLSGRGFGGTLDLPMGRRR